MVPSGPQGSDVFPTATRILGHTVGRGDEIAGQNQLGNVADHVMNAHTVRRESSNLRRIAHAIQAGVARAFVFV